MTVTQAGMNLTVEVAEHRVKHLAEIIINNVNRNALFYIIATTLRSTCTDFSEERSI